MKVREIIQLAASNQTIYCIYDGAQRLVDGAKLPIPITHNGKTVGEIVQLSYERGTISGRAELEPDFAAGLSRSS